MENICVSVFMLTYNQEDFIAQAIEGVLMQKTNFPFQLVIGEDFSADKTREICTNYAEKYPDRIKLILNDTNLGLGVNYVNTHRECSGKYVAICDGDDYWTDPFKLQKQVGFLESNYDYNIVFTNNENIYPSGKRNVREVKNIPETSSFEDLVQGNYIASVTAMFRNKELSSSLENLIRELPYGDWPTYLWISREGSKIHFLKDVTSVYRKDFGTSSILRRSKSKMGEVNLFILQYLQKLPEFQHRLPEIDRAISKLKTGLMASYNKEKRFSESLRLLIQLSLKQNFLYTGRIYLFSFKRLFLNGK